MSLSIQVAELEADLYEAKKDLKGAQADLATISSGEAYKEHQAQIHHLECQLVRVEEARERQRDHIVRTKGLLGLPSGACLHEIEESISKLSEYPLSHLNAQAGTIGELQSKLDEERQATENLRTILGNCGRALGKPTFVLASLLPDQIRDQRTALISTRERLEEAERRARDYYAELKELKAENSTLRVAINAAAVGVDNAKGSLEPVRAPMTEPPLF